MSENGQITPKTTIVLAFCLVLFITLILAFCLIGRKKKVKNTLPQPFSLPPTSSHDTCTPTTFTTIIDKLGWPPKLTSGSRRGHTRKNSDDLESVASSRDSDDTLYDPEMERRMNMKMAPCNLEVTLAPPPPAYLDHRGERTRRESL